MIVEINLLIEAVAGLPGRCCQGAAQLQGLPSQGPAARIALITAVLPAGVRAGGFALACRAGIAALCRTGPGKFWPCAAPGQVNSDPVPHRAGRGGPVPHRVRMPRAGQPPGRHRAGAGPGRDMPGDPGGNGVTAGTGRSPAAGTGKDPGLLGKLTAKAGAPGRVPGRRPGLTPGAGQSRDSPYTKIFFQQTKMFHNLR